MVLARSVLLRAVLHVGRRRTVACLLHGHALMHRTVRMLMLDHSLSIIVRLVHHLRRHVTAVLARCSLLILLLVELVHVVGHAAVFLHVCRHGARAQELLVTVAANEWPVCGLIVVLST